jgi:hypothetical protein
VHAGTDTLPALSALFSESHARFVVSVPAARAGEAAALFGDRATRLGEVGGDALEVTWRGAHVVRLPVTDLARAWQRGLL